MNNKRTIAWWLQALWLLPAAWLVGCSTEDGAAPDDNTGARPIVFSVSTDVQPTVTRGIPLDELDGEFGLFCATYDKDETWDPGHALNFMYNEMVIGNGKEWTTSEGYFVPSNLYKMKFFAYYPYFDDIKNGTTPLVMDGNNTTAYLAPSFTYTMPSNAEDQQDLMYAISDEERANNKGELGTVHLNFHHLLTAITIQANGSVAGTIKQVKLKNLYPAGNFEFVERDVNNPEYGVLRANKTGAKDVYANLNLKVKKGSTYTQADDGLSFMLILQPVVMDNNNVVVQPIQPDLHNEAAMEVTFEAPGGKIYTFTKSLDAALKQSLITNKHTLLRLSVQSLKQIAVSATITDWGHGANFDGAVSDQPVLELEPLISDWDGTDATTNIKTGPWDYSGNTNYGDSVPAIDRTPEP